MSGAARQFALALGAGLAVFFGLWLGLNWPLWIAGLLAAGSYAGVFILAKPRLKIGHLRVDALPDGDELKRLMLDAKDDMDKIRLAEKKITNLVIKQQSQTLYHTGLNILEYLEQHPERISAARRFFAYYLDTAVGILEKYLPFQASGLATEEVRRVTRATEKAMPVLNRAFEKQFTNLMQNDIMDIESDIKVLEMTLKSEGGFEE